MSAIIWDDEEKCFSVVEDQLNFAYNAQAEWNKFHGKSAGNDRVANAKKAASILNNMGKHTGRNMAIGALGGAAISGIAGRAIARAQARRAGASEEDIKRAGRKGALIGAGGGAVLGAGAGYGVSRRAKNAASAALDARSNSMGIYTKEQRKAAQEKTKARAKAAKDSQIKVQGKTFKDKDELNKWLMSLPIKQRIEAKKWMNAHGIKNFSLINYEFD